MDVSLIESLHGAEKLPRKQRAAQHVHAEQRPCQRGSVRGSFEKVAVARAAPALLPFETHEHGGLHCNGCFTLRHAAEVAS